MKKVRHTKRATIGRVEAEYRALDRVVRRLGAAGLERPVPGFGERARIRREMWTGKDALAHIVEWKRQQLRGLRREGADPELRGRDIAEKNAFHRAVHRDVRAALRALPESYFSKPARSPIWPNDLVGHAAGHRSRHLEPMVGGTGQGRSER